MVNGCFHKVFWAPAMGFGADIRQVKSGSSRFIVAVLWLAVGTLTCWGFYSLSQRENFKFCWLRNLVLMKSSNSLFLGGWRAEIIFSTSSLKE